MEPELQNQEGGALREALDSLFEAVYFVTRDMRISYWNKSAEALTGYSAKEVLGTRCSDNLLVHVDDLGRSLCLEGCPLSHTLRDGRMREAEIYFHHKNGHRVPVSVRATPLRDNDGNIIGAVEVFADRSNELAALAGLDDAERPDLACPLTHVGNRKYADIVLDRTFNEFQKRSWPFGVLVIALDKPADLREKYGQAGLDRLLSMAAESLARSLSAHDFVARWEDEVFLVVVPNVGAEALMNIAERSRMLIAKSFLIRNDEELSATASVGATLAVPNDTKESIVARADALARKSSEKGGNRATTA